MMYLDPTHMSQWKQICTIQPKKGAKGVLNYLSIDGMKILLEQINITTLRGRRNLTMLSFLYNSAMRVGELINLTPSNLRLSKPCMVEVLGKGNKKRLIPLDDSMVNLINRYMQENGLDQISKANHPLFYNGRGQKLTRPGIQYIIDKYADMAREQHPELIPKELSPHCFRHSKAMHLLQAGVNLIYIRDILGHVSIETTQVYTRIDSAHKRAALESAYEKVGITPPQLTSWEKDPKLKAFLKSLG